MWVPLRADENEGVEEMSGQEQLRRDAFGLSLSVGDGLGVTKKAEGSGVVL